MKSITNTHLAKHGITASEYAKLYGLTREPHRNEQLLERLISLGLGEVSDSIVADRSGITRRGVAYYRNQLGILPAAVIYRTQEGFPCRSLIEAKYDVWLHEQGIAHLHEQDVDETGGQYRSDFKIGGKHIEILGMIHYKKYEDKWKKKRQTYIDNNVDWKALFPEDVEKLYKSCTTPIIYEKRECSTCGVSLTVSFDGECRSCHRKTWGRNNATLVTCAQCGAEYPRTAGSKTGKFCTRGCYWDSLKIANLPEDSQLSEELKSHSGTELAKRYGVKAATIHMRMMRMRQREAA